MNRAEIRKAKAEQKAAQKAEAEPRTKKGRIRILPIWLRLYIILTLIGASLFLGMMIGYGVIGGGDPFDIFKLETWYHIVDLMSGVED
ncbi:DNA-directed RNA polymerase subunit beta [Alkalicoccobacillus porphyridii]|uniref:DNA-directed RNA polymerase subunit beta n=2 Tax=Alkalicoccobacillus porphyridii TaxID=2597270 RepID=A0A554A4M6_9BACI|nr:DNA-directed RNA polymerase subunit beta [Alkalicoccobacillus porphyridii]